MRSANDTNDGAAGSSLGDSCRGPLVPYLGAVLDAADRTLSAGR